MRKGFTLIEILIVVLIFSIITAFSLSFIRVTDAAYARAELEKLCACMLYLQARACSEQKQKILTFNLKEQSYTANTQHHKLPHMVQFGVQSRVKGPPSDPTHILGDPISFKDKQVIFYPDGTISAGTVYVTDCKHSCLYALTSGISQVSYLRRYKYEKKWLSIQ